MADSNESEKDTPIEETTSDRTGPEVLAVLPLRDIVVFPAHDRAAVRRAREVCACA